MPRLRGPAIGIVAACALAIPATSGAAGVDETCVLPLTKSDPGIVNVAFPDEAATYWTGAYQMVPGLRLRITGRYPHTRYMSFNVYDGAQRPLDALADVQIAPDPGSTNPFATGADRTTHHRRYTAFADFGPIPQTRAPNTLYTGTGQNGLPNVNGSFIYRTYIPDRGRDETGGVGLPTVTVERVSNGEPPPPSVCRHVVRPSVPLGLNDAIAGSNGVPALDGLQPWGSPQPAWRKFLNLPQALADFTLSNPTGQGLRPLADPAIANGGSGAFLSNKHNAYVATAINRRYGQVLETTFRAPTFPDTRPRTAVMPGGQLRYWSMCENEFASQRFIACATDDRTTVDADGYVHYVVSTPAQRPVHANARCGFTWLPWGPDAEGVMIYRNMLPDPGFGQAIQGATYGHEAQTMGDYLPRSQYFASGRSFDRATAGCAPSP